MANEQKMVLIAEDDERICHALSIRLKSEGYRVVTAHDGLQAVSVAVKNTPDVILLDISMPVGDGLTVAERLLKNNATSGIPVIFMTASKKPELSERAIELGARYFFEKPLDSESLVEAVERCAG